jgi:hypothetical protein
MRFQVASLAMFLFLSGATNAATITGPIINPSNGHAYYLLGEQSWTASEAEAVSLGGHLATVRSAAENEWIYSVFGNYGGINRNLWIGLNDVAQEGNFVWVSGEPVTYLNWAPFGEPNNTYYDFRSESYVHLWKSGLPEPYRAGGTWNDNINDPFNYVYEPGVGDQFFGVAEVRPVPEPSTLCLFLGSLAVALTRGKVKQRWFS